jgi:Uma2 family endonuclease
MAVQPITRIDAEEYYQLPEYADNNLIELIEGEVVIGVPPNTKHQSAVGETFFIFMTCAKTLGGKAFTAPIEVYLDAYNIYEPDVLYLAPDTKCVVKEQRLVGAPDLVVEVLSRSTAKNDREKKFRAYEKFRVREYWIIDPVNAYLEVYVLSNGTYEKIGTYAVGDSFASPMLNNYLVNVSNILAS